MPSASVIAMLAKRGSPALSSRPTEVAEEQGAEETSRLAALAKDVMEPSASDEDKLQVLKGKEKKRHRKDSEGGHSRHEHSSKRPRGLPVCPKKGAAVGEGGSEVITGVNPGTLGSGSEILASCKRQLGLVRDSCLPLFSISSSSNFWTDLFVFFLFPFAVCCGLWKAFFFV